MTKKIILREIGKQDCFQAAVRLNIAFSKANLFGVKAKEIHRKGRYLEHRTISVLQIEFPEEIENQVRNIISKGEWKTPEISTPAR